MSTVKISELALISQLNANTSNTLFVAVDIPSGVTGKFTGHTLAQGLYSNEILNVGLNQSFLPNTIAQYSLAGASYIQTNLVNLDDGGTADIVVTANANSGGTDSAYFIDMGFANANVTPGLEFNNLGTSINPLDGYLYVQGNGVGGAPARGGNLIVGATSTNTEIKFIAGGYNSSNIVAKITHEGFKLVNSHPIYFTDGTSQNTASNPAAYSQAAYAQANSATSVGQSGFNQANTATTIGQAAFNKANNALANTTGTFDGSLSITNNLNVNGTIKFANATFTSTQGLVTISASNTGATQPTGGDGYVLHMTGKHNVSVRVVSDSFGANGQLVFPLFGGRAARGNVTNPSAVQTNDVLTRIGASGFGATTYQAGGTARIDFVATENHTDTSRGTAIKFYNVPEGSNTLNQIATFNANSATFIGVVNPQKGFIYTPTQHPGAQTAITIDFANNSVVRANTSAGCTVSFTNFVAGKEVVLWLTNTSGSTQTFTHGLNGLNSTTGGTTYNMTGTSTLMARYFSFDGDLANTFVAVVHA